jgi:hypothetical protein
MRFFAQTFSYMFIGIGYFMAAFTQRRQALHDYIAGTVVTRDETTRMASLHWARTGAADMCAQSTCRTASSSSPSVDKPISA